jgi:hypothetical protein
MGMTIDKDTAPMSRKEIVETLKSMVFGVQAFERFNAKERETLDKAWNLIDQYENRLKADMVAMLEELDFRLSNYQDTDLIRQDIQEKINSLKEA